jgi:hypothetical protein
MSLSHEQPSPGNRSTARLSLPFIDTGPIFDIRCLFLLFPIWWLLGIEQFIWPIALFLIALKTVYLQKFRVVVIPPLKWFGLYILAILISSLFIVENYRWLTFFRNFGAYFSGFLILALITNRVRTWHSIQLLINAFCIPLLLAGVFGLLAVYDVWRPSFESMIGGFLPGTVADSSYGAAIVVRTLGARSWFAGVGEYYRLTGMFLFANHYASAQIFAIPFLFQKLNFGTIRQRLLVGLGIILLLLNLFYTTSRVAMVALAVGAVYFILFQSLQRRVIRVFTALGLLVVVLFLLLSGLWDLSTPNRSGVLNSASDTLNAFVFARGSGSYISRSAVYEASLEGIIQRPIFGWGTERDIEGNSLPAGSHSEYIAVLYRHGLVGFILFVALIWSIWRMTRPPKGALSRQPEGSFLRYGRWFLVTALINSIATDPSVDTTAYVILWLGISLLIAASLTIRRQTIHENS